METHVEPLQRKVVAVINTSEETAEVLREVLEEEGFTPVVAYIVDFKRGRANLAEFFATYRPAAVLYDIALPYIENWNFFQEHVLGGRFLPTECFVITTANKSILDVLVGPTPTIELIGRPFDLESIVQAVRRVVSG
jgi:CheY-like chemotaxis protein